MRKKEMNTGLPDGISTLGQHLPDNRVCASICAADGTLLMEAYAYEVGFFRFNWHPSLEILMVLRGHLKAYTESNISELYEDDILVINPYVGHASILQTPDTIAFVLHITPDYLNILCGHNPPPIFQCCSTNATRMLLPYRTIRSCIAGIYLTLSENAPNSSLFAKAQAHLVLSIMMKEFSCELPASKEKKGKTLEKMPLHAMVKYIDRNFREKITLNHLTEISEMNASYISTYFKNHIGIGFHEYLTRKRLSYAAYMLHNTDDPILDIALDAGFPDGKSFHQAFKKYFRLNPGQYRLGLLSDCGDSVRNLFPVRLEFSDPFVQKKLREYWDESFSLADLFKASPG